MSQLVMKFQKLPALEQFFYTLAFTVIGLPLIGYVLIVAGIVIGAIGSMLLEPMFWNLLFSWLLSLVGMA